MSSDHPGPFDEPISVESLVRYAGSSGDFNPLHYSPAAAAAAGFEAPVVVGSLMAALLVTELSASRGELALRGLDVRFLKPVPIGSRLSAQFGPEQPGTSGSATLSVSVLDGDVTVVEGAVTIGGPDSGVGELPDDFVALGDAFRWPVEEGQARFFGEAVSDPRPVSAGSVVHPLLLPTAMRWSASRLDFVQRLGFDMRRVVHGSTALRFADQPIRVGEVLWVTEGHSGRRRVEGRSGEMQMADAHLIIRDEAGPVRATVTYRIIERPQP